MSEGVLNVPLVWIDPEESHLLNADSRSCWLEESAEQPAAGVLIVDVGVEPGGEGVGVFDDDDDVPAAFFGAHLGGERLPETVEFVWFKIECCDEVVVASVEDSVAGVAWVSS